MCFLFVWFYITSEAPIRDVFPSVVWYLLGFYEENCVGGYHSVLFASYSLRQSSNLICQGCAPYGVMLWMSHQLSVVEILSCLFVSDELDAFAVPLLLTMWA